jgi:predicted Zn-dependent peptidase
VRRVLDDVRTQGVTADELETARSQLRTAVRLGHESTGARMAHLAELTMLGRDDMSVDHILHEFDAVDLDSVNVLAEELLSAPLAVGAVGPIQPGLLPESGLEVGG